MNSALRSFRLRLVIAVLLVAAAVAWWVTPAAPAAPVGSPPPPSADLAAALHLVARQPTELGAAEALALRDCLAGKGFNAPLPEPFTNGTANFPFFLDEASAGANGYGPAADGAFSAYVAALSTDRRAAFDLAVSDTRATRASFTTPNGWTVRTFDRGCVADARRAVYGSLTDWLLVYALPQDLNSIAADTQSDPAVTAVLPSYRECMRGQGYDVQFPQDAESLARSAGPARQRDPDIVRVAVADARCQADAGLEDAFMVAFDQRCAGWLVTNEHLIRSAADILNRARARVAGASSP